MATMKVSMLRGVGQVDVEERSVPEPAADEVLVEVGSVGMCGSDVHYYEHGRIGPYAVDSPLILGHEAGGVVAAVGGEVTSLQVGQRVSIEPGVPCRSCRQSLAGRYNLCPDVPFFATPPHDGAFAEFVAMLAAFVYPSRGASATTRRVCWNPCRSGVWACLRGRLAPGSTVLVTGAAPIGLVAGQTARAYGADTVTVTDVSQHRLSLAEQLGLPTTSSGCLRLGANSLADRRPPDGGGGSPWPTPRATSSVCCAARPSAPTLTRTSSADPPRP
ncbi:MAG TPA: alcohol dehydrogenase catalytic domain-containing protein [Dermatophilaceae bacterium]|nr:alcohol dehydrogenase catalytic domain-containing protein [Dermatophilaceae bacterium]